MKEIKNILNAYDALDPGSTRLALATVIEVKGSSYRRTGARMLIQDNGNWTGGISGGCIEGDALKKAQLVMSSGNPIVTTYDTSNKAEEQIGVSLGCNGIISVLISPVDPNDPHNPVEQLRSYLEIREAAILITVIESGISDIKAGSVYPLSSGDFLNVSLKKDDQETLNKTIVDIENSGKSVICKLSSCELFIEQVYPAIQLIVMGDNYDIYPILKQASELEWKTVVVANPKKLDKVAFDLSNVLDDFSKIKPDQYSACIIMSHSYPKDKANLKKALNSIVPYIGLLGPASRRDDMLEDLNISSTDKNLNRLFGPAGLDIGAQQPEEIAMSIISEIIAVMRNREGSSLKKRRAPINPR